MSEVCRIKFTKSFSSPVLGNVWPGRVAVMSEKQAIRFLELGYAEKLKEDNSFSDIKISADVVETPIATDKSKRRYVKRSKPE